MAKRKTLPKDFADLLRSAPLDELIRVFDNRLLDATGGYSKHTALGFAECPPDLARWLVAQGADVDARDTYQRTPLHHHASTARGDVALLLDLGADIEARDYSERTPLHSAAGDQQVAAARTLIERGAEVDAEDDGGSTPLALCLQTTRNADIKRTAVVAELLLAAGARVDDEMRAEVGRIGTEFEFHRASFNPEYLPATEAGLAALNRLFDVAAQCPRRVHDGVSPIEVTATGWAAQHEELWGLLVPSQGAAATVQGEVVRIVGRVSDELIRNGGANWDADHRAMVDALAAHVGQSEGLPAAERTEFASLAGALRSRNVDDADLSRLAELAVQWVLAHPTPIPLPPPTYRR